MNNDVTPTNNKKVVRKLLLAVVGMFAFGWALVPLYDVICDITGLNGKPVAGLTWPKQDC